ncbi:MAG: hypothetical protein HY788_15045 [Deltaproteobacteria bacterium]|nr:hypothetical protein [Deltaproteobacteria bacterium]
MKVVRILAVLFFLSMSVFLPRADAAFLSVSPTGSFDAVAAGATSITFDVFFNVEGAESFTFISWDIGMVYDTTELGGWTASNVVAGDVTAGPPAGSLNHIFFSFNPATDVTFAAAGAYLLASLTFDIVAPVQFFDGLADFSVLSQIGDQFDGFTDDQFTFYQFAGANGADVGTPDVGAPVPIPGAIWLLGSGLVGLIGMGRRRIHRA